MPDSRLRKHRPFKWLRKRQEDKPGNDDGTHQLTSRKPNATPEPTENSITTAEAEDLWAKARKILAQDKRMCQMLEEATKIVEQHGLEGVSQGTANPEQLYRSLNAKVEELKRKEMVIQIDDRYFNIKEKITQAIRNILVLKDLVCTAASASPPVAIVCASVTVALLMFICTDDQEKGLLDGLEKASGLIPRLRMMEDLYLNSNLSLPSDFTDRFKEGLVSMYVKILEFQARALCFLQKHTLERMFRNMFHEDWNALKANIASQENEARNFTQLIEAQGRKQDMEKLLSSIQKAEERHHLQQSILDSSKAFCIEMKECPTFSSCSIASVHTRNEKTGLISVYKERATGLPNT